MQNSDEIKLLKEYKELIQDYLFLGYAPSLNDPDGDYGISEMKKALEKKEFQELHTDIIEKKAMIEKLLTKVRLNKRIIDYPTQAIGRPILKHKMIDLITNNQARKNIEKKVFSDLLDEAVGRFKSNTFEKNTIDKSNKDSIKNFLARNLRRAMLKKPDKEVEVQDVIEQLLIGRELEKGVDYDREVGRVKYSIKESIPDFIFKKLGLALEVKLSKNTTKSKAIIDEINADIMAYSKEYESILFVVYDLGSIIDADEFKKDLERTEGVSIIIIKH